MEKFSSHFSRDPDRKVRDFGNRASSASHLNKSNFFRRNERGGEISETKPRLAGLGWSKTQVTGRC